MEDHNLSKEYWTNRYQDGSTGWDVGLATPPIAEYAQQLEDKSIKILVPGCGNAHEAEFLHQHGFENVFVLDISKAPLENFKKRISTFPQEHLICSDFFHHQGEYDLILEQTFFCAIDPVLREEYVKHCASLLKPGGKLVGVLWGVPMNSDKPPFGGNHSEYESLFTPYFDILVMEEARNSISPRMGNELFVIFKKK
ncbi:MAG: SAM-dependent methyltransferase [Crocinitomicaceae bacterium]|nr:SAM-dependent methyltransferase [Crocinitomicaceae bacterium]|tara:strand:- start:248 stop:838 length:591 start_codon:yes stop_codon:yes gene_type:complete